MSTRNLPIRNKTTARTRELKEAIVASFVSQATSGLAGFREADWQSVLWWLDISGMAIYFLDRIWQAGAEGLIPEAIERGLERRLESNRIRIKALQRESCTLAKWLSGGRVPYALLKGITLTPDSVPDSNLRCQTDLDFLVAKQSVGQAMHYISRLGYWIHAKSGNTLEFRAGEVSFPDLANIYSVKTQRALELHLAPNGSGLLERRVSREFEGWIVESLSPADILVQQALHLLKHLCGEHTRLSWVLEFWRNVSARSADIEFWQQVEFVAAREHNGDLAMGGTLWVAEQMFGKLRHPDMMQQWQAGRLPYRIQLWLERYVRDLLLGDSIGSKLYALLRNEVPCRSEDLRTTRRILFPTCFPARVTRALPHERFADRIKRYGIGADFFLRRLRFHLVEGIRFGVEVSRWRRATFRCGQ